MIAVGAYPTRTEAELAQTVFDLTGAARLVVDDADASALLNNRPTTNRKD